MRCAETTWKLLEDAINQINAHNASGLSYEELYRWGRQGAAGGRWGPWQQEWPAAARRRSTMCDCLPAAGSRLAAAACSPRPRLFIIPSSPSSSTQQCTDPVPRPVLRPYCRRNAYNMVVNKFGDRLYKGVVETETEHLKRIAAKVTGPADCPVQCLSGASCRTVVGLPGPGYVSGVCECLQIGTCERQSSQHIIT